MNIVYFYVTIVLDVINMDRINLENYKERLLDSKIEEYLKIFGAVVIEGPKWCGKTWFSLYHASSVSFVTDQKIRNLANADPKLIFSDKRPQLIDEWQLVPSIWDAVRLECDLSGKKGNFILTGSTTLLKDGDNNAQVFHSGAGRFCKFKMLPMSLYESNDSNGAVSLMDLFNNKDILGKTDEIDLNRLAYLTLRGGWPANLDVPEDMASVIPREYIELLLTKDIHERKDKRRDANKMRMLLKSLARNEASIVSMSTLVNDISEFEKENERIESRLTVDDYLSVLDDLYITNNQEAFNINYRSSARVGKSPKRHLVDPSLSCALLGLDKQKLLEDLNTFGFMFESLVYRDLCVYASYLGGKVMQFRDNVSGDEVDAIIELDNGDYGAVEIKLSYNEESISQAKKGLLKFYENIKKKPKFMCIIVGNLDAYYKDKETGIYVVPINGLKP